MKKQLFNQFKALLISGVLIFLLSCSASSSSSLAVDNIRAGVAGLIIEKGGVVPVPGGNLTLAGVYVRNNSKHKIDHISYMVADLGNKARIRLLATDCQSIEPESSCLLRFSIGSIKKNETGSDLVIANYDKYQSRQIINYRYADSSIYGIRFSDQSQGLFGSNDHATVYVYSGQDQPNYNLGFNIGSSSLAISNGLVNGKLELPANQVAALEIQANQNITSNLVTVIPFFTTSVAANGKVRKVTANQDSSLQVIIAPTQQANLVMSILPVLTKNESTALLTVANNGNRQASSLNIVAESGIRILPAETEACQPVLEAGASCNYRIQLDNYFANGSALLTLSYDNSQTITVKTQSVYYLNANTMPMVAVNRPVEIAEGQVNQNFNLTYTIINLGNAPLNSAQPKIHSTLNNTVLDILNNGCPALLQGGANCQVQIRVQASSQIDQGVVYLDFGGNFSGNSYNFVSLPTIVSITDSTAPTVTSTQPQNTASDVSVTTGITVNFSEPMQATTLNVNNIRLKKLIGDEDIPLTLSSVSNNNQTVIFTQAAGVLEAGAQYQIVISPSTILDTNGIPLGTEPSRVISTFTSAKDNIAPTLLNFSPDFGAVGISRTPAISLTFSESMLESTLNVNNIILQTQAGTKVANYSISYDNSNYTATINLNGQQLLEQTTYQLEIDQSVITDPEGNPLGQNSNYLVSEFTTGDFTAPELVSVVPVNGATNVVIESAISLTFSEAMNTATLISSTVRLQRVSNGELISLGTAAYSNGNKTVTFQPPANYVSGESYNLVIKPAQITDMSGNPVANSNESIVSNYAVQVFRFVFLTNQAWMGDLDGLSGASTRCNSAVDNPDNTKSWKALLRGNDAAVVGYKYINAYNGRKVITQSAGTRNLFAPGVVTGPIYNSNNQVNSFWSGFNASGSEAGNQCDVWTRDYYGANQYRGERMDFNSSTNQYGSENKGCDNSYSLVCVEQ